MLGEIDLQAWLSFGLVGGIIISIIWSHWKNK
jgi:hypothetical protein